MAAERQPSSGKRRSRVVPILLAVAAILASALAWGGVSLKDFLTSLFR